jgi:hypothetical protein
MKIAGQERRERGSRFEDQYTRVITVLLEDPQMLCDVNSGHADGVIRQSDVQRSELGFLLRDSGVQWN